MAQQTAINFLIEQLQAPCRGIPSHIIEQAKKMERNQIEKSFENGQKIILDVFKKYSESLSNCSKAYYRENYESNPSTKE